MMVESGHENPFVLDDADHSAQQDAQLEDMEPQSHHVREEISRGIWILPNKVRTSSQSALVPSSVVEVMYPYGAIFISARFKGTRLKK